MKLTQLRYICEIVDRGLSISNAARTLHTSQPGISRQIRLLEEELGITIFFRNQKRILSVTPAGLAVVAAARRVLDETHNLRQISAEFSAETAGEFTIAATHTHARYALPRIIERFSRLYPDVHLSLRQGNPSEIAQWVSDGHADLGIATAPLARFDDIICMPCYELQRIVLTGPRHPLTRVRRLNLEHIARYPIITYDTAFMGRSRIADAFVAKGLKPNVVLSAADADVMKTYVKSGLGIAILAKLAYDPAEDKGLRALDASHLFQSNTIQVEVRKGNYLRGFVLDFIELFAPVLTRARVQKLLAQTTR